MRKQLIEKVERCNNISTLELILYLIENNDIASEPAANYETELNLEKELEKARKDIAAGKFHSHEEALKIIRSW